MNNSCDFVVIFLFFLLQYFVRAMFDYDPAQDNLLPCRDIGLPFQRGDILEVSLPKSPLMTIFWNTYLSKRLSIINTLNLS